MGAMRSISLDRMLNRILVIVRDLFAPSLSLLPLADILDFPFFFFLVGGAAGAR